MVQSSLIVSTKGQCLRYKSDPTQPLDIYNFAMKCMDVSQRNGWWSDGMQITRQVYPVTRTRRTTLQGELIHTLSAHRLTCTVTYVALNTLCLYMYVYMYNMYVRNVYIIVTYCTVYKGTYVCMYNITEAQIDSKSSIGLVAQQLVVHTHSRKEWST